MKKIKVYSLTTEEKQPTREGNKYYYPHEKNKLWKIKCSKSDCTYEVFMNYQQIIDNFSLRACDLEEKPDNLWNDEREDETWYIEDGEFEYRWIDTEKALIHTEILKPGDVVRQRPGQPHQLESLTYGRIFEVSTHHEDSDSYRVLPGDSQR